MTRSGEAVAGSLRGLTTTEAAGRLERDGPNVLPIPAGPRLWRQLARQLVHFFALMLWVAGGLAFVAGLPQLGTAIFVVVVFNAAFAFVQEYRAERAAARLRELLPRRVMVIRDGVHGVIEAAALVVGDLVVLDAGDRVPADLEVREAHEASVDTSTLTGESVPAAVSPGDVLYSGTFLTEGETEAVATATGARTRLAQIARLAQAGPRPEPPLAKALRRVVRTITLIAVGVGSVFFTLSLLLGTAPGEGFVFAIGVTVALVPEALLPTVTLSLAIGAQRMAARHALVRKLESVETLGSTTFICTDKTGTLTQNRMSVVEVWTPAGSAAVRGSGYEPTAEIDADGAVRPVLAELGRAAVLCSKGRAVERDGLWEAQGDPMEAALDAFARRVEVPVDSVRSSERPLRKFPFDPRRRRMSVVLAGDVLVKGAPDAVLPRCGELHEA